MMDEKLSALMDDELEAEEAAACIGFLSDDVSALHAWSRQHLVRAALKGQASGVSGDLARSVIEALEGGTVSVGKTAGARVLAFPLPKWRRQQWAAGLALAASVAAVAMVLPFNDSPSPTNSTSSQVARTSAAPIEQQVARTERARANAEARRELQQYLLDHEALASGHGLGNQRAYMRMASPGTAYVTYSSEQR